MKALFVPAYMDGLHRNSGSAVIRAKWIADHMPEADLYDGTQRLSSYNLVVFQKAYLTKPIRRMIRGLASLRKCGKDLMLAFDLCDPDFLEEQHRKRMLEVLHLFDFATAPTEPLTDWLAQWLPAYTIPDYVDVRAMAGLVDRPIKWPPRLVWAGYEGNKESIAKIHHAAKVAGLAFDVISLAAPVPFMRFWGMVATRDVFVNPRIDEGRYKYKSRNKTWLAWAMGMPVVERISDLSTMLDEEIVSVALEKQKWVEDNAGIEKAVPLWLDTYEREKRA